MKLRTLIVDDEDLARLSMRKMLAAEADVEIVDEAVNGPDAIEKALGLKPDLIVLDIEMPGANGFEVVTALGKGAAIIFVTAYDEYAIRAFEANAVDYVLKPVRQERLSQAVRKVLERRPASQDHVEKTVAVARQQAGMPKRIAVRRGKRIVILPLREVIRIEIEDKLVFAITATERLLVEKTIAQLEVMLEPAGFLRISRGELVNQEMIRELMPWFSGTWRVKLVNGEERDVSRERAKALKEAMGVD